MMIGATSMVYLTSCRLFGRQAGLVASALFAVSGLVVHNGAFATFNPLALFFLTLGLWAAVKTRDEGYRWIAACALALALSNAAKYATLAWDPLVIGVAFLHDWSGGAAKAFLRAWSLAVTVAVLDVGFLMLGGADYLTGVKITTVLRTIHFGASEPASVILWRAFAITGVLVLPAAAGVIASAAGRHSLRKTALLSLLVLGALIAPIDQAHLHQLGSLDKNMAFGLPCAAIGAGYAVGETMDRIALRFPAGRFASSAAAGALILLVLITGRLQTVQFRGPSSGVAAELVSAVSHGYQRGTYILSDGAARTEQYYLPQIPSRAWMGIFAPSVASQAQTRARICAGRVSLVILKMDQGSYAHAYDYQVHKLITRGRRYRLAVMAAQGHHSTQVWRLASSGGRASCP